ncbi:hypothetical protein D3C85_892270 [compost metagenome]
MDEDIDTTQGFGGGGEPGLVAFGIGHVERLGDDLDAFVFQGGRGFFYLGRVTRKEADVSASIGEQFKGRATNATTTAGEDDFLAFEFEVHVGSPGS